MTQTCFFKVVIPARYNSHRLPGKPLLELAGKPMIQHVYERAAQSGSSETVIATDDKRIAECASGFGASVCMTSSEHVSGTDRISEVVEKLDWLDEEIVVNVQGDEPLISPVLINQVASNLNKFSEASISTLCTALKDAELVNDPAVVKVVSDRKGFAHYFSRAAIPHDRDSAASDVRAFAYKHIGLYAYRVGFLKSYPNLPISPLEEIEKLEQLRALWNGYKIYVDVAREIPGQDVNTENDIAMVEAALNRSGEA
ncbi:MAG: 3-deoxy-manno-octulosonate cytidylyltransferase [Pseudomonadota bacterium]